MLSEPKLHVARHFIILIQILTLLINRGSWLWTFRPFTGIWNQILNVLRWKGACLTTETEICHRHSMPKPLQNLRIHPP
ncbi:hypothetical protein VTN02DRAFT_3867 [Thermoascus thermophilus]